VFTDAAIAAMMGTGGAMMEPVRVLVVGCGGMGSSHAMAYDRMEEFSIVGLVSRKPDTREALSEKLGGLPTFHDFQDALARTQPDAVSINTYPDTHTAYTIASLEAGAHVFVEKPLGRTVEEARAAVQAAGDNNRALVVGYILRHHPSWMKFVELARTLGTPLAMRMNLNQQSSGDGWRGHKTLMDSLSPIVDCGVHYVDMMRLMTQSRPVRVSAIGARLSDEIDPEMYNYGQLQVVFENGSVGWYEAGWGPMMSETAFFVKDVIGPKGCVSIRGGETGSDSLEEHTRTHQLLLHHSKLDKRGEFAEPDQVIDMSDEPDHQALCQREQHSFLQAIQGERDLTEELEAAVDSLRIVLAADTSVRTGNTVEL
jgi:predicted dehydrogenase